MAIFIWMVWLGGINALQAQTTEWTGQTSNAGTGGAGYKLVPNANGRIPVSGTITLTGNLTLTLVDNVDCSIRNNSGGSLFVIPNNYKLTIIGKEGHKVELHGQASFTSAENPTQFQSILQNTTGRGFNSNTKNNGPLIQCNGGLELTNVVVTNNYNTNTTLYRDAGGIHIYMSSGEGHTNPKNVSLTNVTIQKCHSSSTGGAMRIHGNMLGNVTMNNCIIQQCSNWTGTNLDGGTIRTNGGCSAHFVMNGCVVHNNYSNGNGGAIWWNAYGDGGTATIKNSTFYSNYARNDGGALFNTGAGFSVQACTVYSNTANNDGGGIYCRNYIKTNNGDGNVTLDENCNIYSNTAGNHGGGVGLGLMAVEEGYTPINLTMTLNFNGAKVHSNQAKYGGGISMVRTDDLPDQYQAYFYLTGGNIYNNTATVQGGGAYLIGGIHNSMSGGSIGRDAGGTLYPNSAPNGGGFYIAGGESLVNGAEIIGNIATTGNGGGIFVTGGTTTFSGGGVNGNTASNGNGGGIYSNGGVLIVNNGNITSNVARNGGGGYSNGTLTINGGNIDNNGATDGGGFYVNGGTLNLYGGIIGQTYGNHATNNGGGFYLKGGVANIKKAVGSSTSATVQLNTASNGAGLYMKGIDSSSKAVAYFEDGTIRNNAATGDGGGIYLDNYAKLYMSGASTITGNHIPDGGKGGGVFKQGGDNTLFWVSGNGLKVIGNYAGTTDNASNAYFNAYYDYVTVDEVHGITGEIQLGISVNVVDHTEDLPTPVIHCDDTGKLNDIFYLLKNNNSSNGIFDDARMYVAVYRSGPLPYNDNEIFFSETWTSHVTPIAEFHADQISTAEELAWFVVLTNGLRGEEAHPSLNGTVIADINMSGYPWTPIGEYDHSIVGAEPLAPYSGTFDGKGHTISGLYTQGTIGYYSYGMFGNTKGAQIKNVVLADNEIVSGEAQFMGNLVGDMDGGLIENCIVSGSLDPSGSETIDGSSTDQWGCMVGGLVGRAIASTGTTIIRNNIVTSVIEATSKSGTIYPGMQAFTVGGITSILGSNSTIENCFANPEIHHRCANGSNTTLTRWDRYVGGLVGENWGIIRNCYVRLCRDNRLTKAEVMEDGQSHDVSKFGMFVGYNASSSAEAVVKCYYPTNSSTLRSLKDFDGNDVSDYFNKLRYEGTAPTSCGEYNKVVRPYTYDKYHIDNQVTGGAYPEASTLLGKLNAWATANGTTYSTWMRTKASDVNDDYPVLRYDNTSALDYATVGSKNGIDLEYSTGFNAICGRFNAVGENGTGCLFVYNTPETITASNKSGVKVYIDENVALLQEPTTLELNAYTCQTIKGQFRQWHLIASSLEESPTGFVYGKTEEVKWNEKPNPCDVTISTNAVGDYKTFFPSGTTVANIDLYNFYEPEYHWLNLKRNRLSHWHMEDHSWNIAYNDPDNQNTGSYLVPGRGYLAAIGEISSKDAPQEFLLQAGGTLNNGDVTINVTAHTYSGYGSELKGYNLLGNPYQSYLSFYEFSKPENNGGLWESGKTPFYMVYDPVDDIYKTGTVITPSEGSEAATGEISMHQGFFIVADNAGTAKFTNAMRSTSADGATFRGERPAYPLINLKVTDGEGSGDIAVVEFGRPEFAGAEKMKNIGADGKVYFRHASDDFAILYLDEATDHLPVHFDAIADGTYTMTWSTANAEFSYLHLIDNLTGMDIDMLTSEGYTFTARTDDYKSRFKLMFAYTGVNENEDNEPIETFAFMHDGALTVNGEGMLEVVDMCGRTIASTKLTDAQNTVSLPQAAQGVYLLKLTNDNKAKVQKIVVR